VLLHPRQRRRDPIHHQIVQSATRASSPHIGPWRARGRPPRSPRWRGPWSDAPSPPAPPRKTSARPSRSSRRDNGPHRRRSAAARADGRRYSCER
jgi:hypothetical protein